MTTTTIDFNELKDGMKVRMVLPWWSPNFCLATVTELSDKSGFYIEMNKKIQNQEWSFVVKNQDDLNRQYFIVSDKNYKNDEDKCYNDALIHAKYLLSLTGKKTWDDYFFS
jgi:hypothetical protein